MKGNAMKKFLIGWLLAGALFLCGCQVGSLGKSVAKNQVQTAEGVLYTDSLFTNDGQSRLTKPSKQ
jgi:PBP1b-binding outer membrane lipoprotein LpoB